VIVAVFAILLTRTALAPPFHSGPVVRTRTLSDAEAASLLNRNFKVVQKVRQIPAAVKQSISVAWGLQFNLVDADDAKDDDEPTPVPRPDAPERKMSFAGIADPDAAFMVYEVGGFADSNEVVLIRFGDDAALWCASFADSPPQDLAELRDAIAKRQFSPISCRRPDNEMPKPRGRGR
jgi:hypothetical protein